jgi:hypothetical protein
MSPGKHVGGTGGQISVWLRLRCSKSFASLVSLASFVVFVLLDSSGLVLRQPE